jgi:monoamine oxidase
LASYSGKTDVVIVGAGYAGLSAAEILTDAGPEVTVLEARDRVGGRVHTETLKDGLAIDHGGQWVGRTQYRLTALARRHGVATFPTYDEGENLSVRGDNIALYKGPIPNDKPEVGADEIAALLELDLMAMQVTTEAPWEAPGADEMDSITVHSWIHDNVDNEEARHGLRLLVEAVFSAEPRDLSLLHLLFYLRSAGGSTKLVTVAGGAQESRFTGGAQQVANRIAARLGDRVRLNCPVTRVEYDATGVTVSGADFEVRARRAVIAVPPPLGARIDWAPRLPLDHQQIFQRVPMGCVIKLHVVYDRPFWRERGLSGQVVADSGIIKVVFDNSPEDDSRGVLLAFIEGDDAREWADRTEQDRRDEAVRALVKFFGADAATPQAYLEKSWAAEPYSLGCYAGVFPPGVWTTFGRALRAPVETLHWAGTETATEWMGYIDGAVQSGERAAREILEALAVPQDRWPDPLASAESAKAATV